MAITARSSLGGLHLLVNSTGVKILGEGKWKIRKHGADYRRQWRKVHLGVDAQTLETRAASPEPATPARTSAMTELIEIDFHGA